MKFGLDRKFAKIDFEEVKVEELDLVAGGSGGGGGYSGGSSSGGSGSSGSSGGDGSRDVHQAHHITHTYNDNGQPVTRREHYGYAMSNVGVTETAGHTGQQGWEDQDTGG